MSASKTHARSVASARFQRFVADNAILFIWILFFAYAFLFVDGFGSAYNLKNYLTTCAPLLIAASGLTVVVLNGGIDFSITSVISLVSTICAFIMVKSPVKQTTTGIVLAMVAGVGIGGFVGVINGLAVSRLKMPSFVASLATMLVFSGIAVWFGSVFYDKVSLSGLPAGFTMLGGKGGYFWLPCAIAAAFFLFVQWLLSATNFGRRVYAVGVNPNTAKVSGIPVRRTIFLELLLCGLMAGVAGLMFTAKNQAGITTLGDDMFIDIVGSVVIGGTSPAGGFGSVKKTLYGVLFLVLLSNILNLMGITYTLYNVVKGSFILVAAGLELVTRQMSERAAARVVRA